MNGTALSEFMRDIRATRSALAGMLQADLDREFVYYVCPLTNLRQIVANGILPHASAPADRTDLSGQNVQALRDIAVLLTNGLGDLRHSEVHKCVNFFWNPLNWTFWTFQRHGLLREAASGNPDEGVVCVLEIDLRRLVAAADCFWTLTPRNIAGSGFSNFTEDFFTNKKRWPNGSPVFDWDGIFSVAKNDGDRMLNRKRSAEFIVFRSGDARNDVSAEIPFEFVERILVPHESVRPLTEDQQTFLAETNKVITPLFRHGDVEMFAPREGLLWPEERFVKSLINRMKGDREVVDKLNAAIKSILEFEVAHPALTPTADKFLHQNVADGLHGTSHVVRVMFWAAFLAHHLPEKDREQIMPTVLAAAAIHDLCREADCEDELHGTASAERNRAVVDDALRDAEKSRSCLEAVRLHCVADDKCQNRHLVWQILKDADGLDRGRFRNPKDPKGCDPKFFRTETLRSGGPYHNISWMAHYLAHMTRYMPVDATPCDNLCRAIHDGVEAYFKRG
jgi:hypothetical protein